NRGKRGDCYTIHLSYNESLGWIKDLQESARQSRGQTTALDKYLYHEDLLRVAPLIDQAGYTAAASTTPSTGLIQIFAKTSDPLTTPEAIIKALEPSEKFTLQSV